MQEWVLISFEVEGLGPFRVQGRGCDVSGLGMRVAKGTFGLEFPRVRRRLCGGSKFRVE